MEGSTPLTIAFALGFLLLWLKLGGLGRKIRGIGKQVMTLNEAVAAVESGVLEVATAVSGVQTSVNEVLDDLRNSGSVPQETIDKLEAAAANLGSIASNANTAAQTLREADPTPASTEPPSEN